MRLATLIRLLPVNQKIPLAWLLLKRQPIKFTTAIVGIVFAATLILMQLGFRAALFESSVGLIKDFNADLILVNKLSVSSTGLIGFDRYRLSQIESNSSVKKTIPVRWDYVLWKYINSSENRLAIIMGIDPSTPTLLKPEILQQQYKLKKPYRVLYDRLSRKEFGPVVSDFTKAGSSITFLNKNRIRIDGLITIGTSFGYDSFMLTSLSTFENISDNKPGQIELGFIKLKPGSNPSTVAKQINLQLDDDLVVMTRQNFETFEKDYWDKSKPIGFVFAFGAIMGLLVGFVIVYQILYSDVSSHIQEYATMLSMGFTQRSLKMIVANEALILSSIAYPLAILLSTSLYGMVRQSTNIQIFMSVDRAAGTFLLIYAMCISSALLAMLRLRDADPSDVFT